MFDFPFGAGAGGAFPYGKQQNDVPIGDGRGGATLPFEIPPAPLL